MWYSAIKQTRTCVIQMLSYSNKVILMFCLNNRCLCASVLDSVLDFSWGTNIQGKFCCFPPYKYISDNCFLWMLMSSYWINDSIILQLVEINVGVRLSNSLIAHLTSNCILKSLCPGGQELMEKPEMTLFSVCMIG